jgi:type VI protein secretion system component VasK
VLASLVSDSRRNEEVDEKALIKKLRKRVAELESELSCLLMAKVTHSLTSNKNHSKPPNVK